MRLTTKLAALAAALCATAAQAHDLFGRMGGTVLAMQRSTPAAVAQPQPQGRTWVPGHWEWQGDGHVWAPGTFTNIQAPRQAVAMRGEADERFDRAPFRAGCD